MKSTGRGRWALWLIGCLGVTPSFAGQSLFRPSDPDGRWALISPPMAGAPIEMESSSLLNAPIQVIFAIPHPSMRRSPADSRRARMAAEYMHQRFELPTGVLYYPEPVLLPLVVTKITPTL